jgi:hypothetical protein
MKLREIASLTEQPRKLGHAREGLGIRIDQCQGAAFKLLGEEQVSEHPQPK